MTKKKRLLAPPRPSSAADRQSWRSFGRQVKRHSIASALLITSTAILGLSLLAVTFALSELSLSKTIKLRGNVQAIEQAIPIAHDQSGVLSNVFVTEGELVQEGQIIASLDTSDLTQRANETRKEVARLLLMSECLIAQRDNLSGFQPSEALKQTMGQLQQITELNRGARDCQIVLRNQALAQNLVRLKQKTADDVATLSERIAQTDMLLASALPNAEIHETYAQSLRFRATFESGIKAKHAIELAETLAAKQKQSDMAHALRINRKLDRVSDELAVAEATLSAHENVLAQRFIYATTSGRIQRLRLRREGQRIAAGAHFVEIAPVQTDFEILARASILDSEGLHKGRQVNVNLAGTLSPDKFVPGYVSDVQKLSENKRLIRIHLAREALNKRDLLQGDHSLNGLSEMSEAVISYKPETALNTLKQTLVDYIWPPASGEDPSI